MIYIITIATILSLVIGFKNSNKEAIIDKNLKKYTYEELRRLYE